MGSGSTAARQALVTGVVAPPLLQTWSRRLVSISGYAALAAVYLATLPLLVLFALLTDLVGTRKWGASRTVLFFGFYLGCESLGILGGFLTWLLSGVWAGVGRQRFVHWNFRLQVAWARLLRTGAFRIYGLEQRIEGAEVARSGPYIMLMRHSSVADTMLPIMLASEPYGIRLRWVMKRELLWDPCLDIVGNRLRNCFISRDPSSSADDLQAVASLMDGLSDDEGVLLYPEGTRFSDAKRQRILTKLKDRGDNSGHHYALSLKHVLPPRRGGVLALLAHNERADIVFCAHSGLEAAVSFGDLWHGRLVGACVRMKLWRIAHAEIPASRDEQIAWLQRQWQRVEEHVASTTNAAPADH